MCGQLGGGSGCGDTYAGFECVATEDSEEGSGCVCGGGGRLMRTLLTRVQGVDTLLGRELGADALLGQVQGVEETFESGSRGGTEDLGDRAWRPLWQLRVWEH